MCLTVHVPITKVVWTNGLRPRRLAHGGRQFWGRAASGVPREIGGTLSFLGDKFAKVRTSVSSFSCWREKAEISRLWCWTQPSISGLNKIHFIFVFLRASVLPRPEFLFFCANSGHWPDSCGKIGTSVPSFFCRREPAEVFRPRFWIPPGVRGSNRTHLLKEIEEAEPAILQPRPVFWNGAELFEPSP